MTKFRALLVYTVVVSVSALNTTTGQTSSSDQSASLKNTLAYFQTEIGEDAHLYTGKEYTPYEKGIKGDPFFSSSQMQNGTVFYDGTLYTDIPLLFDIVRQEVVINFYDQDVRIKLLNEKIKYFTLAGHRFENIVLAEGKEENVVHALYDVVFDGRASVLVKRAKRIKTPVRAEEPPVFVEDDAVFVRNAGALYAVDSRNSLLQALNDKNELIKTYIRKNKFRFKKNMEKEIILTAAYYSTLNK